MDGAPPCGYGTSTPPSHGLEPERMGGIIKLTVSNIAQSRGADAGDPHVGAEGLALAYPRHRISQPDCHYCRNELASIAPTTRSKYASTLFH
ncbi:hypothetical protein DHEL01_v207938 [Diaporthe helianthi]|uniref:Uncharacterized protein n=1 Tax=Diaporthe helianthi TaxID=158607 RepID=A0A2P5HTS1_DIAHE|nr:hypothetical protein DHEL01_v207938 [Diaporthe helianthi]